MIGRANRIESGQLGLVTIHFHVFAHQQVLAPSFQRDVIVVHHRYDVGFHVVGPQQPHAPPLDTIPADGVRECGIVLLLLLRRHVDSPIKMIVARRLLIADNYQLAILHRLKLMNGLSRRVDGCRYNDCLQIDLLLSCACMPNLSIDLRLAKRVRKPVRK